MFITERREALGLGLRAADRASGVKDPTWRRLEGGKGVSPENLYRMCQALQMGEDETRQLFDRVGLDFDRAKYKQPRTLEQLGSAIKAIRKATDEAAVVLSRLEAEERERQ